VAETIVLDPAEEIDGRFEFDLTPFIGADGPNWGEAAVTQYKADGTFGSFPIASRAENRVATIPLNVMEADGWTFEQLRAIVQRIVGLWRRKGGIVKRQTSMGPVYAEVVDARLQFGGSTAQALDDVDIDAVLTLEYIPEWLGPWVDLGTQSETANPEVVRVDTDLLGDHPGRVRIVVTNDSDHPQRGLLYGIRSGNYSADQTAQLVYAADDLTPLDLAVVSGVGSTGAFGGTVVHLNLSTNWTPVLSTDIDGVGPMTHVGAYRVFARVHTGSTTPPRIRFVWGVGSLVTPTENPSVELAGGADDGWFVVDLGTIRLDRASTGDHAWRGQWQAAGAAGGESIEINRVWFQPVDEYAGRLQAPLDVVIGVQDFEARDEFNQSAGNLDGKTAAVGGTWDTSGATTDFTVTSGHVLTRATADDSSYRLAMLGSGLAAVAVRADILLANPSATFHAGVAARMSGSDFAALYYDSGLKKLTYHRVAGAQQAFKSVDPPFVVGRAPAPSVPFTLQMYVTADGFVFGWMAPQGARSFGPPLLITQDPALATGGVLEDGAVGLIDLADTAGVSILTRTYDAFAAWIPETDAVIFPGRQLELRTEVVERENAGGGTYGTIIPGDLPRYPVDNTVELLIKASRGDFERIADSGTDDDLSVQVFYRPSYLYVPGDPVIS
jgi:hypothetical protein